MKNQTFSEEQKALRLSIFQRLAIAGINGVPDPQKLVETAEVVYQWIENDNLECYKK